MLKFPRSANEIDPLPDFGGCEGYGGRIYLPEAQRHIKEDGEAYEKWEGEDWKPLPSKPYWHKNGKGQLRYAPPLPPEPPKKTRAFQIGDKVRHVSVVSAGVGVVENILYNPDVDYLRYRVRWANNFGCATDRAEWLRLAE